MLTEFGIAMVLMGDLMRSPAYQRVSCAFDGHDFFNCQDEVLCVLRQSVTAFNNVACSQLQLGIDMLCGVRSIDSYNSSEDASIMKHHFIVSLHCSHLTAVNHDQTKWMWFLGISTIVLVTLFCVFCSIFHCAKESQVAPSTVSVLADGQSDSTLLNMSSAGPTYDSIFGSTSNASLVTPL